MADEDSAMSVDTPKQDTTSQPSEDLDVQTRLQSLCDLDKQITEILERGSAIASALSEGKLPGNVPAKRETFKAAVQDYNQLVEKVNGKLRREVKLLHDASHTELLPLYIPVQAAGFGREKEDIIYETISRTQ